MSGGGGGSACHLLHRMGPPRPVQWLNLEIWEKLAIATDNMNTMFHLGDLLYQFGGSHPCQGSQLEECQTIDGAGDLICQIGAFT